jgi:molybdopterin-guanine dinucleotide biosynthesis protein A
MGRDKAALPALTASGETLVAHAAHRLRAVCATVVLADGGRRLVDDLQSLPDLPFGGPAGGILAAAREWPGRPLLILACDLPAIPVALLAALASPAAENATPGFDWVLPRWERGTEPLCALYLPAALAALAAAAERGSVAPHRLAEGQGLAIDFFEGRRLRRFGRPAELFLNVNTPEDFARWQTIAGRAPSGS